MLSLILLLSGFSTSFQSETSSIKYVVVIMDIVKGGENLARFFRNWDFFKMNKQMGI